jgi:hypothetical protein
MEKEEQRFVMKFLWLKGWGAKRIHEELMSTLGNDLYGVGGRRLERGDWRLEEVV